MAVVVYALPRLPLAKLVIIPAVQLIMGTDIAAVPARPFSKPVLHRFFYARLRHGIGRSVTVCAPFDLMNIDNALMGLFVHLCPAFAVGKHDVLPAVLLGMLALVAAAPANAVFEIVIKRFFDIFLNYFSRVYTAIHAMRIRVFINNAFMCLFVCALPFFAIGQNIFRMGFFFRMRTSVTAFNADTFHKAMIFYLLKVLFGCFFFPRVAVIALPDFDLVLHVLMGLFIHHLCFLSIMPARIRVCTRILMLALITTNRTCTLIIKLVSCHILNAAFDHRILDPSAP